VRCLRGAPLAAGAPFAPAALDHDFHSRVGSEVAAQKLMQLGRQLAREDAVDDRSLPRALVVPRALAAL
jgi:hypothetical protein